MIISLRSSAQICDFSLSFLAILILTLISARAGSSAIPNTFGLVFDNVFVHKTEYGNDPMTDYCARKYVVENNLIDVNTYKVVLNHKNLDIEGINCSKVLETENKLVEGMMTAAFVNPSRTPSEVACMKQKVVQSGFVGKLMTIGVLSNVEITDEQKQNERRRFVEFGSQLIKSVATCN